MRFGGRNPRRVLMTADTVGGVWTYAEEIHGIAAHDLYHTGQIQLIKRLMR